MKAKASQIWWNFQMIALLWQSSVYSLNLRLDVADGLKQLLYERKYDLNSLLQSDVASMSSELGIEQYVAKIIIGAAKKATTI